VLRTVFYGMGNIVFFTVGEMSAGLEHSERRLGCRGGCRDSHRPVPWFCARRGRQLCDFQRVGSMKDAKQQGVYRLESKTYVVKDGDIMHVLAST